MRKYRSHKVVEAAEVETVSSFEGTTVRGITVKGGEHFRTEQLGNKGCPEEGDFIVRYEDGHLSWSPRKAFLDGYAPIDETGADYQPEQVHP